MFVQIHMLQSMPPGNLNRDESGQPKQCLFGGVTRGRISSQCLKRNIRHSIQFKEAFGDALAERTMELPQMVADAVTAGKLGVPGDELNGLMVALAGKFKKEKKAAESEDAEDGDASKDAASAEDASGDGVGQTGQLVFFPPPFAQRIAEMVAEFRDRNRRAYDQFIGRKLTPKPSKDEVKALKGECDSLVAAVALESKRLTVDIGLFGRMTTSDLVINVEAVCQVAHAISTHETLIESDYFTAMDDRKKGVGAAFLGSGETETFFNSAVYYKYLNVDTDAIRDAKHLPSLTAKDAARVAGVLVSAAALATPTGKQNSFASHSIPELILIEVSKRKQPISYANAFLQPVEGGIGRNLMTESAKAFGVYVDSVAAAFAPADTRRVLLAVGPAGVELKSKAKRVTTFEELVKGVVALVSGSEGEASA